MAQFLIVPYEDPDKIAALDTEGQHQLVRRNAIWTNGLARHGILRGGKRLQGRRGQVVSRAGDDLQVTAGVHPPGATAIGGFWVVEAESYDAAVALVADCPQLEVGPVVIREVATR